MPSIDAVMADLFARFAAHDAAGIAALFADESVLIDPNYPPPMGPALVGPEAIEAGMAWAFGVLERSEFTPTSTFLAPDDPLRGALEVSTSHRLFDGTDVSLTQVFVVELDDGGRLRRVQSYTPYPPPLPPPA
ncbi:MAG: nuclear transport factor 2 family protein [Acidimicrobiales bacterium]